MESFPKIHHTRKWLLSIIAIAIIYSNIIVIAAIPFPFARGLPIPKIMAFFFNVYSVFSNYNVESKDYFIWVLAGTDEKEENWVPINIDEYFPYKRGAYAGRIAPLFYVKRAAITGDWSILGNIHEQMAEKILKKYNRLNPEKPATKVKIAFGYWPKSRKSYREFQKPELVHYAEIYRGP